LLLLFGGLAVDFWRALALQRELAAIADSASVAAASGIDEERYGQRGRLLSMRLGLQASARHMLCPKDVALDDLIVTTAADGSSVSVVVIDRLDLGLMGMFVDQAAPLTVTAEAVAVPVLVP